MPFILPAGLMYLLNGTWFLRGHGRGKERALRFTVSVVSGGDIDFRSHMVLSVPGDT